jgi:DNA-binding LytR/AlgR family response regulator
MTGIELASRIRQRRPGLSIVIATGYSELLPPRELDVPRLEKPFRLDKLAATLAHVTGGAATRPTSKLSASA